MSITTELALAHKPAVGKKKVEQYACKDKKPGKVKKEVHKENFKRRCLP
jgi:hypothetical protein